MRRQFTYAVVITTPLGTHRLVVRASDGPRAIQAATDHLAARNPKLPLTVVSVDYK
jgi:hypothetical protein